MKKMILGLLLLSLGTNYVVFGSSPEEEELEVVQSGESAGAQKATEAAQALAQELRTTIKNNSKQYVWFNWVPTTARGKIYKFTKTAGGYIKDQYEEIKSGKSATSYHTKNGLVIKADVCDSNGGTVRIQKMIVPGTKDVVVDIDMTKKGNERIVTTLK